jgi:hypothetical protein
MSPVQALKVKKYLYTKESSTMPLIELWSIAKNTAYSDKTANGLTKMITDYIKFSGGFANRINNMGVYDSKLKRYRKSNTKKGTPDVDAIIAGLSVKIEVKIGKDKLSEDQINVKKQIENSGGVWLLAKDFPSIKQEIDLLLLKKAS